MRQAFLQTYEADEGLRACAMELVDSMPGRIETRIHALEAQASGKAEAGEEREEPKS